MNTKVQDGFNIDAGKLNMSHWTEDDIHLLDTLHILMENRKIILKAMKLRI